MKKNIYILGGKGLIGSELVKLYSREKVKIIVLDIDIKKLNYKRKGITYIKFDCTKNHLSKDKERFQYP